MHKLLFSLTILCITHNAAAAPSSAPKWLNSAELYSLEQFQFDSNGTLAAYDISMSPQTSVYSELTLSLDSYSLIQPELSYLKDVRLLSAWNYRSDTSTLNYLPGLRFAWTVAGFDLLTTDIARSLNTTHSFANNRMIQESGAYKFNVNWRYPFALSNHGFSLEGLIEYNSGTNAYSEPLHPWLLAKPRLRYDLARLLDIHNPTYLGLEYQYWRNRQGLPGDDSSMQLKFSWGL